MPLKTHKKSTKHPHHYAKVYWPYIPLVVFVLVGLWVGKPFVERSQRSVLAYTTDISTTDLLVDTNHARQTNGDKPLTINPQLSQAAQAKANDMATRNYWSHITPDGKTPWTFIDKTGYQYQKAGENLAYGFNSTNDVVAGWMNSPAHRQNLLDDNYSQVGFGIVNSQNFQNSGPETIVVALYAKPGNKLVLGTSTDSAAFSTDNPLANEASITISKAQAITGGYAPWISLLLGIVAGAALMYVILKNSVSLHRTVRKGEKFVVKHPVLDVTILVFVAICALLYQSVGLIR